MQLLGGRKVSGTIIGGGMIFAIFLVKISPTRWIRLMFVEHLRPVLNHYFVLEIVVENIFASH